MRGWIRNEERWVWNWRDCSKFALAPRSYSNWEQRVEWEKYLKIYDFMRVRQCWPLYHNHVFPPFIFAKSDLPCKMTNFVTLSRHSNSQLKTVWTLELKVDIDKFLAIFSGKSPEIWRYRSRTEKFCLRMQIWLPEGSNETWFDRPTVSVWPGHTKGSYLTSMILRIILEDLSLSITKPSLWTKTHHQHPLVHLWWRNWSYKHQQ